MKRDIPLKKTFKNIVEHILFQDMKNHFLLKNLIFLVCIFSFSTCFLGINAKHSNTFTKKKDNKVFDNDTIRKRKILDKENLLLQPIFANLDNALKSKTDSVFIMRFPSFCCTNVPKGLEKLINLQVLSFNNSNMSEMDSTIGNFDHLQVLDLRQNQLKELPNALLKLKNLEELNLEKNAFTKFPMIVTQLTWLKSLTLSLNLHLSKTGSLLPPNLENLQNLEHLNISGNLLKKLPPFLGNFPKLKELNISNNLYGQFPTDLLKLTRLEILILRRVGGEKALPVDFSKFLKLKTLDITANLLAQVPNSVYMLGDLETLILDENPVSSISNDILKLKNLKTLSLKKTNVPPAEINKLKNALPKTNVIF